MLYGICFRATKTRISDGKYTNFCLLGIFDTKKNAILYFGYFTVMNHTYLI